jgi:hypothetical protein
MLQIDTQIKRYITLKVGRPRPPPPRCIVHAACRLAPVVALHVVAVQQHSRYML